MRILSGVIVVGLLGMLALAAYVRLAPSDPARWHVLPEGVEEGRGAGYALRRIEAGPDTLATLDEIARATPRTNVLAGTVEDGTITYVTRSALMGFPDYTTVALEGDTITLYARLRFGASDMGVNAARLEAWLAALAP
ncbi:MAG: DUF1499 domain-containing protein [Pseudomonadota bacterium]